VVVDSWAEVPFPGYQFPVTPLNRKLKITSPRRSLLAAKPLRMIHRRCRKLGGLQSGQAIVVGLDIDTIPIQLGGSPSCVSLLEGLLCPSQQPGH